MILGFALWAGIAAVIWLAWPSCRRRAARWWLLATMLLLPWVAWLYWLPRGVRYRRGIRRRRPAPFVAPTAVQHRDSVLFWRECQRTGTPTQRAIAPQMLTLLNDSPPVGAFRLSNGELSYILVDPSLGWPNPRLLDNEY